MAGKLVLYVECLVCRHVGEIPQANLDPDVLPFDLKPFGMAIPAVIPPLPARIC